MDSLEYRRDDFGLTFRWSGDRRHISVKPDPGWDHWSFNECHFFVGEPDTHEVLVAFDAATLKATADHWLAGEYGMPGVRDFTATPWQQRSYGPTSGTWEYRYTGGRYIEATPAEIDDWKSVVDIEADGKPHGTFHTNWLYARWRAWEREWMRRIGVAEHYVANRDLMREQARRWGGDAGRDVRMGSDKIQVLWQYHPLTVTRTDEHGIPWAFKYGYPAIYAYSPLLGRGHAIRLTDGEKTNDTREVLEARIDRWVNDQLAELVDRLTFEFPELKVYITRYKKDRTLVINMLSLPRRKQRVGIGTKVMRQLTAYADQIGYRLAATPTDEFGMSKTRLIEFAKRFGFEKNIRRGFAIQEWTMLREPQKREN
ncbi:hypothetical protein ACFVGM_09175 [Kitasatospora purpeofusca]|uniref:hypothetical protein n=1 Tax=Kitasatospora purpeofusca TaxID=67352 RepID=UPI00369A6548